MRITQPAQSVMRLNDMDAGMLILGVAMLVAGAGVIIYFLGRDACLLPFGAVFLVGGLVFLAYLKRTEAVIDKGNNTCTVSAMAVIGGRKKEFDIRDVKSLVLESMRRYPGGRSLNSGSGKAPTYSYTLAFIKADGRKERIPFGETQAGAVIPLSGESDQSLHLKAQQVAGFLGVPLQREELEPPDAGDMMKSAMEMGKSGDWVGSRKELRSRLQQ